jgi:beta-galactosidase
VYSVYPIVELWLNGTRISTAATGKANQFTAEFSVTYAPGTLVAKGLDIEGNVQEEWQLTTAGTAQRVDIVREDTELMGDGSDINYLAMQLLDEAGNPVYHWEQDKTVMVTVEGAAKLIALGNAKPDSAESFQQSHRQTFRGKLMAVVQSTGDAGEVKITVTGQGLKPTHLVFTAK